MAKRRLAHLAVLTAATLLAPLSSVPGAGATDPAAGPTAFTGTVYLPDGETVAKAAVVDLSLAGVKPFARGVSGLDGRFSVDVPETEELVALALALAAGSRVSVRWTASDLYPQASVPPPSVSTQAVLGTVSTSPGFGQVAGEFVAYLIDTTTNALANALSDPTMVEFRLPDVAGAGPLVTKITDLAHAAGIFNDPDMVAGNEDLSDPDLVPPLFADRDTEIVTDAALDHPALPSLEEPWEATDNDSNCTVVETWTLPARGTQHMRGTRHRAVLQLRKCNEHDENRDYYMWAWGGKAASIDTPSEYVRIWRYKYRTELVSHQGYDFTPYEWVDVDPRTNVSDDDGEFPVNWSIGFERGVTASVGGTYHVLKAKKTHPWSDYDGKLYHVSWLSNRDSGSRDADFWNGGGMAFVVPNGEQQMRVRTAKNSIDIWRCWWPKSQPDHQGSGCDPRK